MCGMTDIYNNVGKLILAECKANRVTYKYACVNKIRRNIATIKTANELMMQSWDRQIGV